MNLKETQNMGEFRFNPKISDNIWMYKQANPVEDLKKIYEYALLRQKEHIDTLNNIYDLNRLDPNV